MNRPTRPVVLAGIKHCGKSTLGRMLARRWNVPLVDTDAELEAEFARRTGRAAGTREIFRELGEEAFRKLEAEVIRILRQMPAWEPAMLDGKPTEAHVPFSVLFRFDDSQPGPNPEAQVIVTGYRPDKKTED